MTTNQTLYTAGKLKYPADYMKMYIEIQLFEPLATGKTMIHLMFCFQSLFRTDYTHIHLLSWNVFFFHDTPHIICKYIATMINISSENSKFVYSCLQADNIYEVVFNRL